MASGLPALFFCHHWNQPLVDVNAGDRGYNPLTCPTTSLGNYRRGAGGEAIVVDLSHQHNDDW